MPLYEQIIQDILQDISTGRLKDGDMLPTELQLCEQYNVSRPTVRTALLKLAAEGRLHRVKGRGTFVTRPKVSQESTSFIESYNEEMRSKGLEPKTEVLKCCICRGDAPVCEKLGLEPGSSLFQLRRLRSVIREETSQPVVLTTVWLPAALTGDLSRLDFIHGSLYQILAEHGVTVHRARRILEIKLLYGKTARCLAAPEGSPAHFISSIGYDETGRAVEYSESFYPADRNQFIIQVTNET